MRDTAIKSMGEEEAQIFDAHYQLLNDPEINNEVISRVKDECINVEWWIVNTLLYKFYSDILALYSFGVI